MFIKVTATDVDGVVFDREEIEVEDDTVRLAIVAMRRGEAEPPKSSTTLQIGDFAT